MRGLSGDLSQREDTIAKINKEKKALEELQQVRGMTPFMSSSRRLKEKNWVKCYLSVFAIKKKYICGIQDCGIHVLYH